MKKIRMDELSATIEEKRKEVNHIMVKSNADMGRKVRNRVRNRDEVEALTKLAIASWKKAEDEGKIKMLGERVMYYDYRFSERESPLL